jgi:D-arabinose 5-phosphate isomerase GutQ
MSCRTSSEGKLNTVEEEDVRFVASTSGTTDTASISISKIQRLGQQ